MGFVLFLIGCFVGIGLATLVPKLLGKERISDFESKEPIEQHKAIETEKLKNEEEKRELKEEIKKLRAEKESLALELEGFQGELRQTQNTLSQTQGELEQTKDTLSQTQGELQQTKGTLSQTQGELQQTKGTLSQTQGELQQTEATLSQTESKLKQTQDTLSQTKVALELIENIQAKVMKNTNQIFDFVVATDVGRRFIDERFTIDSQKEGNKARLLFLSYLGQAVADQNFLQVLIRDVRNFKQNKHREKQDLIMKGDEVEMWKRLEEKCHTLGNEPKMTYPKPGDKFDNRIMDSIDNPGRKVVDLYVPGITPGKKALVKTDSEGRIK